MKQHTRVKIKYETKLGLEMTSPDTSCYNFLLEEGVIRDLTRKHQYVDITMLSAMGLFVLPRLSAFSFLSTRTNRCR